MDEKIMSQKLTNHLVNSGEYDNLSIGQVKKIGNIIERLINEQQEHERQVASNQEPGKAT